ncbi:cation-transporting P-type ATPase [Salinimonas marina]|uniref:Cation-transporting P-type ATPase n=1 Tax=Salinimonas marina TaxID=2785918 RepID=A0A7S9DVJ5_9ALTE|nr:cation-transporting P-type ATPase [Salinimonas marina]QPG04734.1 cation-transporting P-type ATPase [Salinimonas marina]
MQEYQSWHNQTSDEALCALESTLEGLSADEVMLRLQTFGPNKLPGPAQRSQLLRFLSHFNNILIYVLIGAASITALLGHMVDTFVIVAVVIINAIIGYYQEGKAEKAMQAIRQMLALLASVKRDGKHQVIAGEELVPGDIVYLEAGDKLPADLRLLKSHSLRIQESILTGESVAVEKQTTAVPMDAPLGDRFCIGFSGTTVTSGQGMGVVIATGAKTEIGRIGGLLYAVQTLETPLVSQLGVFARWLTLFILAISVLMLLFGYFVLHHDFTSLFMAVVGIAVAAIPEGLPAVLTITLAVGVKLMAQRSAIVRRLPAIETLGSVSVICTDKTGTLTRNEMTVDTIVTSSEHFTVKGVGYAPCGDIEIEDSVINGQDYPSLKELGRAAALCNDAELIRKNELWSGDGDPMEIALLALASKIGIDRNKIRNQWTRTDIVPFDSKHKYMATLEHHQGQRALIYLKGAPETILSMCLKQRACGDEVERLNTKYWEEKANTIASRGRRVLAFAIKTVEFQHTVLNHEDMQDSLIFLGLTGLIDPPREEARKSIEKCHRASIDVKMITGDHAITASAIGKQLGFRNSDRVLTGQELDNIEDAQLKSIVGETGIFARTNPEQKLRLVMALQANNMTVAMTGDGVNDAPALKRADVGVAMGKTGSEAAKEASDIVLVDDNFATIVAAVREGRTVYDNIKKVISWTLPTNAGEALTIVLALLLGLNLPITPIQILWINMITAVTLGIALAFEPTEENTMQRPPRLHDESLLAGGLLWHILLVAGLFLVGVFSMYEYAIFRGYSEALARTIAMNTLVVLEIFHLFFIRNMYGTSLTRKAVLGTRVVWAAVIVVTLGQFAITYLPWLQTVFETQAINLFDGVLIITVGVIMFFIIEIEKQIRLRVWNNSF